MVREILSLHIGQAGVQMGSACWELYCTEHNISPNGRCGESDSGSSLSTFYNEVADDRYVPRALFFDTDPTVINNLRNGAHKELFHPEALLNGSQDAANNFARGRINVGRHCLPMVLEKLRLLSEECNSLQGLIINHSLGGGTGSGFTSLLAESISAEFSKKSKMQVVVYPAPQVATSLLEPYNSILSTHYSMDHMNIGFLSDNEAVYDLCKRKLGITMPSYHNLNRLVAQAMSSITLSLRFGGMLNVDINEFQTNLVPFPRVHFPLISYAPIVSKQRATHQTHSIQELTNACFDGTNQFVNCDLKTGKYMSCCLLYRGDVSPNDVTSAIKGLKSGKNLEFVSWCPTGFKTGVNQQKPLLAHESGLAATKRALCVLSNNTAIRDPWIRLKNKFNLMYKKGAYVHWYLGEGMELCEFDEANENITKLISEYTTAAEE